MKLSEIIAFNRLTLQGTPIWIYPDEWVSPPTLYNYGLPRHVFHLINLPQNTDPTEADVLCLLLNRLATRAPDKIIRYLEIGVSVGKNAHQIATYSRKFLHKSDLHCIELEKPNATFFNLLNSSYGMQSPTIETFPLSQKKPIQSYISPRKDLEDKIFSWKSGDHSFVYHEGDEFDQSVWSPQTFGGPINLVFSDALHTPDALMHEYLMLKMGGHLNFENLIYCFDDLESYENGPMWESVYKIHYDLKSKNPALELRHFQVNGWLGQHEYKHNFGVISSDDLLDFS